MNIPTNNLSAPTLLIVCGPEGISTFERMCEDLDYWDKERSSWLFAIALSFSEQAGPPMQKPPTSHDALYHLTLPIHNDMSAVPQGVTQNRVPNSVCVPDAPGSPSAVGERRMLARHSLFHLPHQRVLADALEEGRKALAIDAAVPLRAVILGALDHTDTSAIIPELGYLVGALTPAQCEAFLICTLMDGANGEPGLAALSEIHHYLCFQKAWSAPVALSASGVVPALARADKPPYERITLAERATHNTEQVPPAVIALASMLSAQFSSSGSGDVLISEFDIPRPFNIAGGIALAYRREELHNLTLNLAALQLLQDWMATRESAGSDNAVADVLSDAAAQAVQTPPVDSDKLPSEVLRVLRDLRLEALPPDIRIRIRHAIEQDERRFTLNVNGDMPLNLERLGIPVFRARVRSVFEKAQGGTNAAADQFLSQPDGGLDGAISLLNAVRDWMIVAPTSDRYDEALLRVQSGLVDQGGPLRSKIILELEALDRLGNPPILRGEWQSQVRLRLEAIRHNYQTYAISCAQAYTIASARQYKSDLAATAAAHLSYRVDKLSTLRFRITEIIGTLQSAVLAFSEEMRAIAAQLSSLSADVRGEALTAFIQASHLMDFHSPLAALDLQAALSAMNQVIAAKVASHTDSEIILAALSAPNNGDNIRLCAESLRTTSECLVKAMYEPGDDTSPQQDAVAITPQTRLQADMTIDKRQDSVGYEKVSESLRTLLAGNPNLGSATGSEIALRLIWHIDHLNYFDVRSLLYPTPSGVAHCCGQTRPDIDWIENCIDERRLFFVASALTTLFQDPAPEQPWLLYTDRWLVIRGDLLTQNPVAGSLLVPRHPLSATVELARPRNKSLLSSIVSAILPKDDI